MPYATEQEVFWQGVFGDEYIGRNQGPGWVASNTAFFANVLGHTAGVRSVLELGSNIGLNLMALRQLLPDAALSAVEINERAAERLKANVPGIDLHLTSILQFEPRDTWDLVFTKCVLIHIPPERLADVYDLLYRCSREYILVAEYYNPTPMEVVYRGHTARLFKRDFAGEMLDAYPDLRLVGYGFVYQRDASFPQDDVTWFLLRKDTPAY
jgi:pseudaminic acid biosynthesis-associated methylase